MQLVAPDNPILWSVSRAVVDAKAEVVPLLREMRKLLGDKKGIGLAAPQVGVALRFFIIGGPPVTSPFYVFVNPSWEPDKGELINTEQEGCLSWPGQYTMVSRPYRIIARWETVDGRGLQEHCAGLFARCFQHECDHLDGHCIFPRPVAVIPA